LATGRVRPCDRAGVEGEVGADLDDERLRRWAGMPAVIATRLHPTPRVTAGAGAVTVSLTAVADDPSAYLGKRVSVSGEITDVYGARAFVLGDRLLVISGQRAPSLALTPGKIAQVAGELRPFDRAAVEREIGADLDDALGATFGGKPAIIARSINLVT
jgi:hypothetical protein